MLRDTRLSRRWSLRKAGREAGVSAGTIVHLEKARRAPSRSVAEAIIGAYGLRGPQADALRDVSVEHAGRDWLPPWARFLTGTSEDDGLSCDSP